MTFTNLLLPARLLLLFNKLYCIVLYCTVLYCMLLVSCFSSTCNSNDVCRKHKNWDKRNLPSQWSKMSVAQIRETEAANSRKYGYVEENRRCFCCSRRSLYCDDVCVLLNLSLSQTRAVCTWQTAELFPSLASLLLEYNAFAHLDRNSVVCVNA